VDVTAVDAVAKNYRRRAFLWLPPAAFAPRRAKDALESEAGG
jgi:hypothetical protein